MILKRDGRKVDFDADRIKFALQKAYKETYDCIDDSKIYLYTSQVCSKIDINTDIYVEQVQDIVESVLKENEEIKLLENYKAYRIARTDIRESQTNLMKTYQDITFSDAEESDLKRENGNVDGNTSMGMMLQYGSTGAKNFALKKLLNKKHAKAHAEGAIHIHDMDFLPIGTLTCLTGDTYITLKDKDGNIINTNINHFNNIFEKQNNIDPEWKDISNYYILARNGWTKLEKVMRRKINKDDKLYNIKTHKGLGLKVTENHRIPIVRNGKEELLFVKDINIGDSLLTNPHINQINEQDTFNLVDEFCNSPYLSEEQKNNIWICNIRKLKQWMLYKYEVNNLPKLINSNTSKNGNSYLTISQFKYIMDNYDIPYEVLISLEITIKNSKHSMPMLLPITNELATVMGYIYGDGSVSQDGKTVTLCNIDPLKLNYFKECYEKICNGKLTLRKNSEKQTGWLINNSLFNLLMFRVLGYKYKANNIKIPQFIFTARDEIKWGFISGLTDTDGCCTNGWAYTTVCKEFAEQLIVLLKTLNIDTKIEPIFNKGSFTGFEGSYRNYDNYRIRLTDAKNISIMLNGLNGVKRNDKLLDDIAYIGNTVKFDVNKIKDKILIEDDCYVYDIQTTEHWFMANNYVVHNCCQIDIKKLLEDGFSTGHGHLREPNDILSYSALAAIAIQSDQNDQHGIA